MVMPLAAQNKLLILMHFLFALQKLNRILLRYSQFFKIHLIVLRSGGRNAWISAQADIERHRKSSWPRRGRTNIRGGRTSDRSRLSTQHAVPGQRISTS